MYNLLSVVKTCVTKDIYKIVNMFDEDFFFFFLEGVGLTHIFIN